MCEKITKLLRLEFYRFEAFKLSWLLIMVLSFTLFLLMVMSFTAFLQIYKACHISIELGKESGAAALEKIWFFW